MTPLSFQGLVRRQLGNSLSTRSIKTRDNLCDFDAHVEKKPWGKPTNHLIYKIVNSNLNTGPA